MSDPSAVEHPSTTNPLGATGLPSADDLLADAMVVGLPMRTRFRGQTLREIMLFRGPAGWGEFGPFPEYQPAETANWLASGIEAAYTGLGTARRDCIPVNATMPAVAPDQVEDVLLRFGDPDSIPAVKVKVAEPGQNIDHCVARVREVARLVPQAGIRVDANGAWSIPQAVQGLERIAEAAGAQFEYAEQPVAGVEPLAELREALHRAGVRDTSSAPLRIAADEAVRKASDPLQVARLGAADLLVVKAPPLGGVSATLALMAQAGLPVVVSSALDSSVGLTAGLALAARLPQLPYACGLGTVALFTHDVATSPLRPINGQIQVPVNTADTISAPAPDLDACQRLRITGDRESWWHQRLRQAHAVLVSTASTSSTPPTPDSERV